MATTTIPWDDGSGDNIYLTYSSASGDQTVEVSSDANTGGARTQTVTFTSGVGSITQQLTVSQEAGVTEHTITVYPSSYDTTNSSFGGFVSNYGANNAYASATSTSQCRALLITGSNAVSTVYWKFDLSSIPAGAEIKSISLQAKVLISNTTYCPTVYLCVCEGTTEKGNHSSVTSNSQAIKTLDVGTGWTRDKLQNLSLLFYSKRGTSNTAKQCYQGFYGATLTIKYTA